MGRISLSLRLVLIVVGAMFLLQLVAVLVQVSRDDGFTLGGVRPSFAREVVAVARIFDRLPPRRERAALELLNQGRFSIAVTDQAPQSERGGPLLGLAADAIKRRLAEEGLSADRIDVSNVANSDTASEQRGPLVRLFGRHLRISVRLDDGRYLVLDPASDVDAYVYGNIVAVAAGIVGLVILAVAIWLVLRETLPLRAVAAGVDAFAKSAVPQQLPERGAPELRSLIRATNSMQHEIAALIRNRALILAGMSHDLRTQVTRLRLRLELLDPSPTRDSAIADVEAMHALIEESLEFAAASSSADGGRADAAGVLAEIAAERGPAMSVYAPAKASLAIGETPLRRLLDNLIGNAIAYGERADVTVSVGPQAATIAVADRGPGIPLADRKAIFEPFYRLESSRSPAHGGTGLGLAIVQQIVDRHQGTIEITDRPGGGSVFTVVLPLAARG